MANGSRTFDLATVLLVAGLAVMLYGVSLNDGQALNALIATGGVVVVAAISVLTAGIMSLDDAHHPE